MASKYHTTILKLVKEIYPQGNVREEQNLFELVKNYNIPDFIQDEIDAARTSLSQLRIDIYIVGQCAIEVHGEQHYQPIQFSNEIEDPEKELKRRKSLDNIKQSVLYHCGIPSLVLSYKDIKDITLEILEEKITNAILNSKNVNPKPKQSSLVQKPGNNRTRDDAFRQVRLEKERKARKERYKKYKLWKQKQRNK